MESSKIEQEKNESGQLTTGKRKRTRESNVTKLDQPSQPPPPLKSNEEVETPTKQRRNSSSSDGPKYPSTLIDFYLYGYKTKVLQPTKESELCKTSTVRFPTGMHQCKSSIPGNRFGVCCSRFIAVGTWIGPYEGEVIRPEELTATRDNEHMWEIYKDGKLSHYVDGSDAKFSNWMSDIQCARHKDEQNMTVFQYNGNLYYRAFRDILPCTELLVWYDDRYTDSMDMESISMGGLDSTSSRHAGLSGTFERRRRSLDSIEQMHEMEPNEYFGLNGFNEISQWKCGQCEQSFTQRVALQMHMCSKSPEQPFQCGQCSASFSSPEELRGHVVKHVSDKPFKCGFCARTFSGSTTLSNHIRKHTGEKPFKCRKCGKYFSQSTQLSRHEKLRENCAEEK